jgi:hypothetical protein
MRKISIVGVLMALLASDRLSQDRSDATGTIQGTVFTSDTDRGHSAVPPVGRLLVLGVLVKEYQGE